MSDQITESHGKVTLVWELRTTWDISTDIILPVLGLQSPGQLPPTTTSTRTTA